MAVVDSRPITVGRHHFADESAVLAALRQRSLGRLALSLDGRYRQYQDLLDRLIRVATLCERAEQPHALVATSPSARHPDGDGGHRGTGSARPS
jgi:hypothetical protein